MTPKLDELTTKLARAIMLARDDGGCVVKDWDAEVRDNPHVAQAVRQALAVRAEFTEILEEFGAHKDYGDIPCRKTAWDFEVPCVCGLDEIMKGGSSVVL